MKTKPFDGTTKLSLNFVSVLLEYSSKLSQWYTVYIKVSHKVDMLISLWKLNVLNRSVSVTDTPAMLWCESTCTMHSVQMELRSIVWLCFAFLYRCAKMDCKINEDISTRSSAIVIIIWQPLAWLAVHPATCNDGFLSINYAYTAINYHNISTSHHPGCHGHLLRRAVTTGKYNRSRENSRNSLLAAGVLKDSGLPEGSIMSTN